MMNERLGKVQFRLNTIRNSRQSMGRIIRMFQKGEISGNEARTLRYLMDGYLAWFKLESDLQIEQRIEAIEKVLEKR